MYVYERIIGHMDNLLKFSTYLSSYIKSPPWVSDNSMVWGFKPQWRTHWIMKLVCLSFSCFSNFVHETKTRFSRWGVSVVWRTACWPWRSVLSWWSLISTGRAVPSSRIDRRVDHTETLTCTSLGPTCRVGGRPARGKDPLPIHEGASRHASSYTTSSLGLPDRAAEPEGPATRLGWYRLCGFVPRDKISVWFHKYIRLHTFPIRNSGNMSADYEWVGLHPTQELTWHLL